MDSPPAHAAGPTTPELAIVRDINEQRRARGLKTLQIARRLVRAARSHSLDMLRQDRLSHTSSDGTPFSRRLGRLRLECAGETLAWVPRQADSRPEAVVRHWLESPPHRQQLLDGRYRLVGVGQLAGAMDRAPGIAVTADFGA
jgi:uncharacterized protein YkwD